MRAVVLHQVAAPTKPPASPMALVSCPRIPRESRLTRIVRRYWALGVALTGEAPSVVWRDEMLGGMRQRARPLRLVECLWRGSRHQASRERSAKANGRHGCPAPPAPSRHGERLFLIDGPSLVYRAFFALPESIATSTGEPTNAIFGFASMLVKIVTEYGVCPTVVAWDAGTSGRTEMFAEYKAQRRSRPDLLKQQWPAMEPLVEASATAT